MFSLRAIVEPINALQNVTCKMCLCGLSTCCQTPARSLLVAEVDEPPLHLRVGCITASHLLLSNSDGCPSHNVLVMWHCRCTSAGHLQSLRCKFDKIANGNRMMALEETAAWQAAEPVGASFTGLLPCHARASNKPPFCPFKSAGVPCWAYVLA